MGKLSGNGIELESSFVLCGFGDWGWLDGGRVGWSGAFLMFFFLFLYGGWFGEVLIECVYISYLEG